MREERKANKYAFHVNNLLTSSSIAKKRHKSVRKSLMKEG